MTMQLGGDSKWIEREDYVDGAHLILHRIWEQYGPHHGIRVTFPLSTFANFLIGRSNRVGAGS